MKLLTLLAADYANIAQGGKLNVMGIFRNINAQKFPIRLSSMHLVVKLGAELGEYGITRQMTIILMDEDGNEMLRISGNVELPDTGGRQRPEANAILELKDIVFPNPGTYDFVVLIDKEHKGRLSIEVVDISQKKE